MELTTVLEQVGLTQKEAAVYLAALELGRAPVLRIAAKANIKRPTAYVILEELQSRGLIEAIPRGRTNFYQAVEPQAILSQLKQRQNALEEAMPQLQAILNTADSKPKVRFYEGKQGIFNLYDTEILRQATIFSLVNLQEFAKRYSQQEMIQLLDRMKESNVVAKELIDSSATAKWYLAEKNRRQLGETKLLLKKYQFPVDFVIYEKTLVMISLKNLMAVVIEDAAISTSQRQLMEILWDSIK